MGIVGIRWLAWTSRSISRILRVAVAPSSSGGASIVPCTLGNCRAKLQPDSESCRECSAQLAWMRNTADGLDTRNMPNEDEEDLV
jgi:hypothetical protein